VTITGVTIEGVDCILKSFEDFTLKLIYISNTQELKVKPTK